MAGKEKTFLDRGQRRQDELGQEIKQEGKRNDDPGVKREVERDRDRIGDAERAQSPDLRADFVERPLQE